MTTKFNVGDTVLIKGIVETIYIETTDNEPIYHVRIKSVGTHEVYGIRVNEGIMEERPRGEWNILQKDDNGIHEIECPFCKYSKGGRFASVGVTFHKLPPFCESCGADMRREVGK